MLWQIISVKPTCKGAINIQQRIYLVGLKVHLAWNDMPNSKQYYTLLTNPTEGESVTNMQTSKFHSPHWISSQLYNPFWKQPVLLLSTFFANKLELPHQHHRPVFCTLQGWERDQLGSWQWYSQTSFLCPTVTAEGGWTCSAACSNHNLRQFSAILFPDLKNQVTNRNSTLHRRTEELSKRQHKNMPSFHFWWAVFPVGHPHLHFLTSWENSQKTRSNHLEVKWRLTESCSQSQ